MREKIPVHPLILWLITVQTIAAAREEKHQHNKKNQNHIRMSWVRIWVHLVFSTKNRNAVFDTEEKRRLIFQHIKHNADEKKLRLDCVNGYKEHAHCLISLNKEINISKVAQLIKGESAHWVNENNLLEEKLVWQDDYYAVSVSESHLQSVRNYIHNQEEHHKSKSFNEEIDEFEKKYGWSLIKNEE